eukprot:8956123-Pyramimonas_sp.AAC.1
MGCEMVSRRGAGMSGDDAVTKGRAERRQSDAVSMNRRHNEELEGMLNQQSRRHIRNPGSVCLPTSSLHYVSVSSYQLAFPCSDHVLPAQSHPPSPSTTWVFTPPSP